MVGDARSPDWEPVDKVAPDHTVCSSDAFKMLLFHHIPQLHALFHNQTSTVHIIVYSTLQYTVHTEVLIIVHVIVHITVHNSTQFILQYML